MLSRKKAYAIAASNSLGTVIAALLAARSFVVAKYDTALICAFLAVLLGWVVCRSVRLAHPIRFMKGGD